MHRLALTSLLCASALHAQTSLNVDLLSSLDAHSGYTDVWGYVAPNGKEYALLATDAGTAVIDCTDPVNPVERGLIPGFAAPLRDIKTWSTYAYVISEGLAGMQIIDLGNPDAPTLVTTWGTIVFGRAHNLAIDQDTGWLYALGTDVGTVVFDASVDPRAPAVVGIYGSASIGTYIHDMAVQDGVGHAAMLFNGTYRTLDVTTWPFQTLAEEPSAARFAHNAWPSADNQLAVTTDEQEGGLVEFWDVSDPTDLTSLSAYSVNTQAVPHNAFLHEGLCHVAWYTEGYRVLDVSDPTEPVEIGYHDTFAGPPGTTSGAFGVYPFQPSGVVYVSDRTDGLLVLRPHALRIHHDTVADTTDEDGPYPVLATPTSPDAITGVTLWWSTDTENFTEVAATPTGNPGEFGAAIPGQAAPRTVHYYLTATDAAGGNTRYPAPHAPDPLLHFDVGNRIDVFADDFESSAGWTSGASLGTDDWEHGTPAALGGYSRTAWLDAQTAHSGTAVRGNDLGLLPGADGAYPSRNTSWLQSSPIATGGEPNLQLELWRWLNVDAADRARILVNGQIVWQNPTTQDLQEFRWGRQRVDVSGILDTATTATIRFELQAGADKELGGWNLDDVALFALGDCVPPVPQGSGTPGSGAITPSIGIDAAAKLGAPFAFTGEAMLGGSAAALLLASAPASIPVAGITLLVDPASAIAVPAVVVGSAGPGNGTAVVPVAVPASPGLDGVDVFAQWVVADPAGAGGLAASAGLRVRICRQ